jgi:hypothetical protein
MIMMITTIILITTTGFQKLGGIHGRSCSSVLPCAFCLCRHHVDCLSIICIFDFFLLLSHCLQIVGDKIVSATDHAHLFTERILMHPLSFFAPASYSDAAAPHSPVFQQFMNACADVVERVGRAATAQQSFDFGEKKFMKCEYLLVMRTNQQHRLFLQTKSSLPLNLLCLTCSNSMCTHQVPCSSSFCYQADGGR